MKVVAFNGSPRPKGNTYEMIQRVFGKLAEHGIDTELVQLGGNLVRGCTACGMCKENKNMRCSIDSDMINDCLEKMYAADGVIIGSPTYFASLTSETKALLDRAGYVSRANGTVLKYKVGAAVTAVRRAGALNVFNAINQMYLINEMFIPGTIYWNLGIGQAPGDVKGDDEGMATMDTLAENMAYLLKKLQQ